MKLRLISLISFFIFFCMPLGTLQAKARDYQIGRGDLLEISVWESPDLSKTVAVDDEGSINYAFLGKITAAGTTPEDLAAAITKKLEQGYVKEPKVDVTVKEFNSKKILVFGEVEKPGLYKIRQELPVLEMLFLVGGVNSDAKRMTVIRPQGEDSEKVPAGLVGADQSLHSPAAKDSNAVHEVDLIALLAKGDLSQNILIWPGDTVYVASGTGEKFYVLGQVNNPGPLEWTGEISVLEAIKLADGPTEQAALNRILLRKGQGDQQTETKVNIMAIMKGKQKDDTVVEPGNIIIVPRSWV